MGSVYKTELCAQVFHMKCQDLIIIVGQHNTFFPQAAVIYKLGF